MCKKEDFCIPVMEASELLGVSVSLLEGYLNRNFNGEYINSLVSGKLFLKALNHYAFDAYITVEASQVLAKEILSFGLSEYFSKHHLPKTKKVLGITIGKRYYTQNGEFIVTIVSEDSSVQDSWIARVDHIANAIPTIYITYNKLGEEVYSLDEDGSFISLVNREGFKLSEVVSFD